jgi:hypothetical protein
MKRLLGLLLLLSAPAFAVDLCDDGMVYHEDFQELQDALRAPSIQARFELNKDCDFSVLTTTLTSSDKSLKDFMKQITDPVVNKASATAKVKAYSVKKNADGTFEQTVTASKSIMTATIVNTCKWTTQTDEKMVYECNLKNGDGVLKNNKTVITCTNSTGKQKKCTFQTNGRAISQFMKGACTLAAGGAAETVNGIQRLMEYVTYGKVDPKKWEKPGKIFYNTVSEYDSGDLNKKNFVFQQQIQ